MRWRPWIQAQLAGAKGKLAWVLLLVFIVGWAISRPFLPWWGDLIAIGAGLILLLFSAK